MKMDTTASEWRYGITVLYQYMINRPQHTLQVENGNFFCFGGRDILKTYSAYGESDQCSYKNSTEHVTIFKIKHESKDFESFLNRVVLVTFLR